MIQSQAFDYSKEKLEYVNCNFCGSDNYLILSKKDRNGLDVRMCICKSCGLMFLNPRMTREGYDLYYQQEYRSQMERLKIKESSRDDNVLFERGKRAGREIFKLLGKYLKDGITIDVGSGTGGILKSFQELNPALIPVGIEPSSSAAEYAIAHGVKTYTCLFEDFSENLGSISNIMSMRNLNHLLDPKAFLAWAYQNLSDDGRLVLLVQNFRHASKDRGKMISQVDHCYYFVPETIIPLLKHSGFEIIFFDNPDDQGIYSVLKKKKAGLPASMKIVAKKVVKKYFSVNDQKIAGSILKSFSPIKLKVAKIKYLFNHAILKYLNF